MTFTPRCEQGHLLRRCPRCGEDYCPICEPAECKAHG